MKQKSSQNNLEVEEVVSFTEQELEEIRERAIRKAKETKHRWRQRGRWLVCKSCETTHAIWIGNKVMVGEDKDGSPILKDREEVLKKVKKGTFSLSLRQEVRPTPPKRGSD